MSIQPATPTSFVVYAIRFPDGTYLKSRSYKELTSASPTSLYLTLHDAYNALKELIWNHAPDFMFRIKMARRAYTWSGTVLPTFATNRKFMLHLQKANLLTIVPVRVITCEPSPTPTGDPKIDALINAVEALTQPTTLIQPTTPSTEIPGNLENTENTENPNNVDLVTGEAYPLPSPPTQ